jgi:hypothetical protein
LGEVSDDHEDNSADQRGDNEVNGHSLHGRALNSKNRNFARPCTQQGFSYEDDMTSIQIDIKDGLSSSVAIKGPCRVATTANITLSGEQTIDGVAVVTDDRVLVKDQTTGADNGIYIADTGPWRRSKDFNKSKDIKTGTLINVTAGTTGVGWWQVSTTGDITVGTTSIAFSQPVMSYDSDLAEIAALTTTAYGRGLLTSASVGALSATWTYTESATGGVARTIFSKFDEMVSITDFGAVGDGDIGNASANATALTNALATGKRVFIPYTASGYHFGANTITLSTGQKIIGENKVVLKTTTTTMMFSCTGYGQDWGVSNVKIDATGCGSSSTIFRFRTASAVVYKGRFDNIDFLNQYEAFGDEASANYVVDMRITNIAFLLSLGRPVYIRHSRGFFYWENIQHSLNTSARATSWECGRFEDAVGLEINRWDCSGGPIITNSTCTITIASPAVVTWTAHNLVANDGVRFTTTGALPTGLSTGTTYFVKTVLDANTFTVSATAGGAAINTSGVQSGTHTATRAAVYQSAAYGLVITTSTSVWLNRVEVDSTWGNGIILSTIRFLRTNQVSAYHNLGNQITASAITESALSDTVITGASGDIGDGNGGGLTFDTSSNNVVISNLDITNTSASALILNNVTNFLVENYSGYSNTGYGLALLGTTDRCIVGCNLNANTAGTVLNTASGTNNFVKDIASYQLPTTAFSGTITPKASDGAALGTTALQWSDIFLASGGVVNFNNGNYTVTHTAGRLTFSGSTTFTGAITVTGGIVGTTTNDNATALNVGEYVESVIAIGSAVALTTGVAKDVATVSLTAGDWDVEYITQFTGGTTTTVTYIVASISQTLNTLDQTNGRYVSQAYNGTTVFNNVPSQALGMGSITVRMSLSATTTIRAVAQAVFATSTCSGYGLLRARRVR